MTTPAWLHSRLFRTVSAAVTVAAVLAIGVEVAIGYATSRPHAAMASPSAIAAQLGCTGYAAQTPTLYARAEATCMFAGGSLDIATFASESSEHAWLKVARLFGGQYVTGPLWVVGVSNPAAAGAVRVRLGVH